MSKLLLLILSTASLLISCQSNTKREPAGAGEPKTICASNFRRKVNLSPYTPPADGEIKVAFFDADSTLRISKSGSVSANSVDDVRILPNVARVLRNLQKNNYLIYIVSNQNGVGSGVISCQVAEGALRYTISEIIKNGGSIHGYDFAENNDEFRKPYPGMALALEQSLKNTFGKNVTIDKKNSFMVGDSAFKKAVVNEQEPAKNISADLRFSLTKLEVTQGNHFSNADRLVAQAVGIYFYEATDFFGWRKYGIDVLSSNKELDEFLSKCRDCAK